MIDHGKAIAREIANRRMLNLLDHGWPGGHRSSHRAGFFAFRVSESDPFRKFIRFRIAGRQKSRHFHHIDIGLALTRRNEND